MRRSLPAPAAAALLGLLAAACSGGSDSPATPAASSGRWFVDAGGPIDGDGSSWARADRDLARVLGKARHGEQVWVAAGTYRPAPPGGSRESAFALAAGVAVYGGFAGGETALAQRDPAAHPTTLDGDLLGDDRPFFAQRADNVWHVVVAIDAHGAQLDGFTIRGGYADGPSLGATPESGDQGSGINVYHGGIAVRDCTLRENWASNHGTVNDHSDGSVFERCTFESNASAQFGAGLYLHHEAATLARECTFRDNAATSDGAGAYVRTHHGARFEQCWFDRNRAERGGGMYSAPESAPMVADSLFTQNVALIGGAGSYCDDSFACFQRCEFVANDAGLGVSGGGGGGGGSGGGGIWTNGGAVLALACEFRSNRASFGGGFYAIHEASALVSDSTFEHNQAHEAGGLYTLNSAVAVLDCVFRHNVANGGDFAVGGGLSNYYSDSLVEGCTFENNAASLGGGGLYNEGEDPVVRACRFVANTTDGPEGYGGAIFSGYFTRALVEDCAFVGNRARSGGGTYDLAFSEARFVNCTWAANVARTSGGVHVGNLATPSFENCVVALCEPDGIGGYPAAFAHVLNDVLVDGDGNVAGAPTFARQPSPGPDETWGTADDDAGDLALAAGSLGIDAGRNAAHSGEAPATDLAGAARFVDDPAVADSGSGDGPVIDLGALERQP